VTKSWEDGYMLSFDSVIASTSGSRSDLSRAPSVWFFRPVYNQDGQERSWSKVMRFNMKSCNTIIEVRSFSAKNQILLFRR
jgi:hypothetical protein